MALDLARQAMGRTSPNPMVGAVVVKEGQVVGTGYHVKAGAPHAEVLALNEAGEKARGATLYVNLEPCCHHGRTGPCTEAVIKAGIGRVVAAMTDPNPLVAGYGFSRLREAGVEVATGIMEAEALRLNEVFIKFVTTKTPFVVMKAAMSLDGKIATRTGKSRWITGPESREYTHRLRDRYDAIMVGVGTVLADDPSLTTRLPGGGGKDPVRVIVDSKARIPPGARVITRQSAAPAIVAVTPAAPVERVRELEIAGATVLYIPGRGPRVDLRALFAELGSRGITSLLVEGGAGIHGALLDAGLADKVVWFIAPKIFGGSAAPGPVAGLGVDEPGAAAFLREVTVCGFGDDICVTGYMGQRGG
jgi:diaminohydroxyphosphoribosylaminopyrimidine deaminase/5-amino-6-(5-phosphoribosylamino)uracil reductase